MHAAEVRYLEKPRLKNPILIEGLPGIGNVGRIAASYLIKELKAKKFAELYSHYFLPLVILQENASVHLLKCELYYKKAKDRDIVFLILSPVIIPWTMILSIYYLLPMLLRSTRIPCIDPQKSSSRRIALMLLSATRRGEVPALRTKRQ